MEALAAKGTTKQRPRAFDNAAKLFQGHQKNCQVSVARLDKQADVRSGGKATDDRLGNVAKSGAPVAISASYLAAANTPNKTHGDGRGNVSDDVETASLSN